MLRNGKSVGPTGHADQQPIGRPQGLHIKLAAAVTDPGRIQRIGFQLRIMGGVGNVRSLLAQIFNDRHCQRRALDGIRTGAQLVDQHQGIFVRLSHNINNIHHVRGESGQVLGNALFISDISKNTFKNSNFRADICRHEHA